MKKKTTEHKRRLLLLALASTVTACVATASSVTKPRDEALPPGIALATFDTLWAKVSNTYVDTAFVSHDWVQVRDSLRPRAATITARRDLDRLIAETLRHIPDSHFYIIPARIATEDVRGEKTDGRGTTGLALRMVGDEAVVWRVEAGSPAAVAGIHPGDVIIRVGDKEAESALRRVKAMPRQGQQRGISEMLHGLNGALSAAVGDTVTLEIAGKSSPRVLSLVTIPSQGLVSQFGNLPPLAGLVRVARMAPATGSGCVGVIAFNIWLPALGRDLERAIDIVRGCSGVVVDLRGNPGGVGAMVMGFGGYFVDSTLSLGTMRTRQVSLKFAINPRRSRDDGSQRVPYSGPLAILVDPMTASTSEIFATGMQRIGRARVFGEKSAGAALPALMERLPSGDVFVHAVADFTDPDGRRIEGAGVVPDEVVPLTEKALKDGRDTALEAAMRWIATDSAARPRTIH